MDALLCLLSFCISHFGQGDLTEHPPSVLFKELLNQGVPIAQSHFVKLPQPIMPDGLSEKEQLQRIQQLPGRSIPVEELIRPSSVAPFVLRIHDIESTLPQQPGRAVDLYFVTPGTLDQLLQADFLDQLLNSGRKDAQIQPLDQPSHKPRSPSDIGPKVGHAHIQIQLMDRVLLRSTQMTSWHRTKDSIVVAAKIDPAFNGHEQYPNCWFELKRNDGGRLEPQMTAQGYHSAGYYLKLTTMHAAEPMLFVEWHLAFAEPAAWFDGANLLRSKLPLVIQTKVRAFRRDLMRK